jgi:ATP adenylyltransferase
LSNDRLWAPWRLAYIKGLSQQPPAREPLQFLSGADPHCFFCRDVVDDQDRTNLVVHRGARTITLLNRYPYNNGHLLVAPREHLGRLDQLDDATQLESLTMLTRLVGLLEKLLNADGFNVGLNLGRVAGAGVPGHLHWHIVPRWNGDTNFMPVVGDSKVISQSLDALWELLVPVLQTVSVGTVPNETVPDEKVPDAP